MNEPTLTVAAIPLKDGQQWEPTDAQLVAWQKAFPMINVREEICGASVWCWANPRKRKTERGVERFLTNWFLRAKTGYENSQRARKQHRQTAGDRITDLDEYFNSYGTGT
jgi:hypothetical protein